MEKRLWGAFAFCCAAALGIPIASVCAAPGDPKTVDGITVYLGVVPAEMIVGHPGEHAESRMHGGIPSGRRFHHIVVYLIDPRRPHHPELMDVRAKVHPPGLAPEQRKLEPMHIGNTISFGNYFFMPGSDPFRITIEMKRPGEAAWHGVDFEYRHPR